VWRLLAAILWLGNVDFEGEEDAAVAAPAEALANAAALLGVAEPALATALTERVLSAGARPGPPAQERLQSMPVARIMLPPPAPRRGGRWPDPAAG